MLDGRKYFGRVVLRVVSQLSENGIDPRKHATARPVILNNPRFLQPSALPPRYRLKALMKLWDCQMSAIGRR